MLIVGLLAWGALTTLWLMGISPVPIPRQFASFVGIRASRGPIVKTTETPVEHTPVRTVQSALEHQPTSSAIYRTSIEQLDQDYDANEVAIQSKIGDSPVRVSGSIAEIHEDTSGHPIVTLHNGSGNGGADMLLTDDQRSAAAQLAKEDTVEIQCNKMQRIAARLHGSGCVFVLVDANAKPVYLAVSLSNKTGNAPLYIVGPMSRNTCLASSDTIAEQVTSNSGSDRILSKSCAATARESVSLEGCHLSSTMSAIPDIPTAHLWKYECMQAAEARRAADTKTSRRTLARAAAAAEIATLPQPAPASAVAASDSDAPAPKAPRESASGAAAANPPDPAPPPPIVESNRGTTGGAVPASVNAANSGGPQPPTLTADAGSAATAAAPTTAVADDLTPVRTKDPGAAERIASYCSKLTSTAANPMTIASRCRQDEMAAWTRLVVQNEFPSLDETARHKCSEPPFPDSFVARESCAKYQLHLD